MLIELRKAVLEAAGWRVESFPLPSYAKSNITDAFYDLIRPDGTPAPYGKKVTEIGCWQRAPAVESSIDAALEYLTLADGCSWLIQGPVSGHEAPVYSVTITDAQTGRTWHGRGTVVAEAMCRAFFRHKRGAK